MLVAYVKQETLEPIKGLGRFALFGVLGSLLIGTGVVLLSVGILRALQTETRAYRWLVRNAERFGFCPYFYEPWHWEYCAQ